MTRDLESNFHQAMLNIYTEAAKLGYHPTAFRNMALNMGGLATAKRFLSTPYRQSGFTRLRNLGRLDLSVEAHVITYPWSSLFTRAEKEEARRRLRDNDYQLLSADD